GTPTIGGVAAANVSGPRRIQSGAARDFMLGVRFADGRGQIIKNGGRVMKNVTGYDLVKLMAGSYGTLGVLTEVSLKVLPKPRFAATLRIEGLADDAAVGALGRALGSPYEVTGAAHLPGDKTTAPTTLLRLEGFENSVAYRAGEIKTMLADLGNVTVDANPAETEATWAAIRDVAPYHDAKGDVWRISVKPTDGPGLVAGLTGARAFYDWGGGLVWLLAPEGSGVSATSIRAAVARVGGHATLMRGNPSQGVFQPLSPAVNALQDGLRRKFDPRQILNPGLMTEGQAA
ncbi:MAG: glycolate oxidase subunit GlcE, partial [Roseovarius sp.]|nr:glycolate oxidase subunit GlcE [Roseovarius sp.]